MSLFFAGAIAKDYMSMGGQEAAMPCVIPTVCVFTSHPGISREDGPVAEEIPIRLLLPTVVERSGQALASPEKRLRSG
jgi:hypothetical protein